MNRQSVLAVLIAAAGCLSSQPAHAAAILDGASMGWRWAVPFVGMLLSIAVGPLVLPKIWHRHYGKIAAVWAALTILAIALTYGADTALAALIHAILAEYLSFIVLIFALYTVAGGILVTGTMRGTPLKNTAVLALGSLMASIVGTTGAAMILIRPLIRANAERTHNAHVVIFFIILVANVGGALTPLGDPPLFAGFLRGVNFFWPAQNVWMQTALVAILLLAAFCVLDVWRHRRDVLRQRTAPAGPIGIHGATNLVLIALIVASILVSATWKPGVSFDVYGTRIEVQNLTRDGSLLAIAALSLLATPKAHRDANDFSWEPMREVAELFAGIFVAIIPVLAMLQAGRSGAFSWLVSVVSERDGSPHEVAYFWLTGLLSAFLDNVPTYLVFFQLAGGDARELMGPLAGTLASISMGAVYMGALTYIGNAPNFMIYAIARKHGIKMPNFFGYMLWAAIVLVPLFALLTLLPIAPILKST
jgi:Na+/H+ antiporter NhaD/arsenite permease-like protein